MFGLSFRSYITNFVTSSTFSKNYSKDESIPKYTITTHKTALDASLRFAKPDESKTVM